MLSGIRRSSVEGKEMAEPFRSAILWVPDEVEITYQNIGIWIPSPFDTQDGRMTLAGDAAHPMASHRGQGFNHAVQDSFNFLETVRKIEAGESTQGKLIQEYSNEIVDRGAKECVMSRQSAFMSFSLDTVMESAWFKHGAARMPE